MTLLQEMLDYCERTGTRVSFLGRQSIGDSTLVAEMQRGRVVTDRVASRIRAMMAKHPNGMHTTKAVANFDRSAAVSDNRTHWEVSADARIASANLLEALRRMAQNQRRAA